MASTIRIVPQEEIGRGTAEPPRLRVPGRAAFAERAARLRELAARSHPDAPYLVFIARLCDAQDHATPASVALPDELRLQRSLAHGLPPLGVDRPLDPQWRETLRRIVSECGSGATPEVARTLETLARTSDAGLDEAGRGLLDLDYPALDPASAPFVAAALQVHWAAAARELGGAAIAQIGVPNVCPACGTPPVASVLAIDIPAPGTRYLHCALCQCEWLFPRGQCTFCEERGKVAYFHVDGGDDAAKAEACEACHGYLKVFNREKDAMAEPVADDLATMALDVLMDNAGYQRAGPNLLFLPGAT